MGVVSTPMADQNLPSIQMDKTGTASWLEPDVSGMAYFGTCELYTILMAAGGGLWASLAFQQLYRIYSACV